jgi:transposase
MFTHSGQENMQKLRTITPKFRKRIVEKIESGQLTAHEAQKRYHILGHSTILKWCRRYGQHRYPVSFTRPPSMPSTEQKKNRLLQHKVRLLEQELKEARLKQATLETLIEIAEEQHSIVIKKNSGGKPLKA